MNRRDYYFIAGGIFVFLVGVFLTAFFLNRRAQIKEGAAVELTRPSVPPPGDLAHQAVAQPQEGFIRGTDGSG
jgi:hypothetical protein